MTVELLGILIVLTLVAIASVLAKKLTTPAAVTGWLTGLIVFIGSGFTGVLMIAVFFILGTVATSVGISKKVQGGLAEEDKGKRKAGQVLANAGVAGIIALLAYFNTQNKELYLLMIAASLASATSDTLSSEIGNVYGSRFYNILSFKKDTRGLNGVVSLEGTLAGVLGSIIIAVIYSIAYTFSLDFFWIVIAGTAGNLFDSILGATLERKKVLNNDSVNFLNTLIAALIAGLLSVILGF